MNRSEAGRQRFVEGLLRRFGALALVPWPVYTEATLFLQQRGLTEHAVTLGRSLLRGDPTLVTPTTAEHATALDIVERYAGFGVDLPDAVCIAMSLSRGIPLLTWDFRHVRAVVVAGRTAELVVSEAEFRMFSA